MSTILPCLRGQLGDWVYYSSLMTAKQLSELVLPAKDIREADGLEDFLQRELQGRVEKIAKYLLERESRFFNSLILGVFGDIPDWHGIELTGGEVPDAEGVLALQPTIGFLKLTGAEQVFAIDGQHRARAIELASGQPTKVKTKIHVKEDQFPVVFVAHIDDKLGKKRTRRLFYDINKRAVPVSRGDLAIIDEEDVCAIAARRLFADYPRFNEGKLIATTPQANLDPSDTEHFTNLLALGTVCRKLRILVRKKRGSNPWDEVNVQALADVASEFLEFAVAHLEPYNAVFIRADRTIEDLRVGDNSLLFRPLGLEFIARLYARYKKRNDIDTLAARIGGVDYRLGGAHLQGVLWTGTRLETKNKSLAWRLQLHLLGDLEEEDFEAFNVDYLRATHGTEPPDSL